MPRYTNLEEEEIEAILEEDFLVSDDKDHVDIGLDDPDDSDYKPPHEENTEEVINDEIDNISRNVEKQMWKEEGVETDSRRNVSKKAKKKVRVFSLHFEKVNEKSGEKKPRTWGK